LVGFFAASRNRIPRTTRLHRRATDAAATAAEAICGFEGALSRTHRRCSSRACARGCSGTTPRRTPARPKRRQQRACRRMQVWPPPTLTAARRPRALAPPTQTCTTSWLTLRERVLRKRRGWLARVSVNRLAKSGWYTMFLRRRKQGKINQNFFLLWTWPTRGPREKSHLSF